MTWGKGILDEALALGSDGWMADFAEWLPHDATLASGEDAMLAHNRYPVAWARLNHEVFHDAGGRIDALAFVRSAWLGSQPYVDVVWAGGRPLRGVGRFGLHRRRAGRARVFARWRRVR